MKTNSILLPLLLFGWLLGARETHAASQPNAWQIADNSGAAGLLHFTNTLTAQQKIDATNQGWHFTVVSRLVGGSPNPNPGQFMIYGLGDRRFIVGWDTNDAGEFTARFTLTNGTTLFTNLTASGEATNDYHRHELVYDPATREATYLFDGVSLFSWAGLSNDAGYNGQAAWGAASNNGRGRMNYHLVQFAIGGQIVSEYFGGSDGNPAVAPSPTNQGWTLTWTVPSTAVTNFPVSPDTAILPPVVVTLPATDITTTNATVKATVNPGNFPGAYFFQSGLTTNYGSVTPVINLPPGDTAIAVSNALIGLSPGALYHFRIVATNSVGVTYGSDLTFTTAPASPVSLPVSPAYTWSTLAGYSVSSGADGVGTQARFNRPAGVAADANGNTYVVDADNYTIRRISAAGVVSTIAGSQGVRGFTEGVNGTARFFSPSHIAVDPNGNVFVSDHYFLNYFAQFEDFAIRKISPVGTNWVVTTIAFNSVDVYHTRIDRGDRILDAGGLAADSEGNVYLAEPSAIRKISAVGTNWVVSLLANSAGYASCDGGSQFCGGAGFTNLVTQCPGGPGITVGVDGSLYVASQSSSTVSKLSRVGTNWVCTPVAGLSGFSGSADGVGVAARFRGLSGISADRLGNLYVADGLFTDYGIYGNQTRKVEGTMRTLTPQGTNWLVTTLAGQVGSSGSSNGSGTNALFNGLFGVAVDRQENLIVSDSGNDLVRKVTAAGAVSTIAGSVVDAQIESAGSVDGAGREARFNQPGGVALDRFGNVYVADSGNYTIRVVTPAGSVNTVAGSPGISGSVDGVGSDARFGSMSGIAVDSGDNIYVTGSGFGNPGPVRRITPAGVVSTIPGVTARDVTVDKADNVLVLSSSTNFANLIIKKLSLAGTNWVVSPVATTPFFEAVAFVASDDRFYVLNEFGGVVQIAPVGTNWVMNVIAGVGGRPHHITADGAGNLYLGLVHDNGIDGDFGHTVLRLSRVGANWLLSTIGGPTDRLLDTEGGNVDGAGSVSRFQLPYGIAADISGNVYVGDVGNNNIRKGVFTPFTPINQVAYATPLMNGRLTVTLTPTNASGQWRFPWELGWHNSGVTVSNLVAGNYPIEFRNVPGWIVLPLGGPATLSSGAALSITNVYYPTLDPGGPGSGSGSLTVFLGPTPPAGAGWRFLGESTAFFANGFSTNLQPGTYLIEFAAVNGRIRPSSQAVQVNAGQPSFLSVNYLLAATPPVGVELPFPVPANQVGEVTNYPFGFNGQLQTDTGYGSGVAVQANVVLTAAHLVFNDQTLSYVRHAYWFFRRDAGVSEPLPQEARGFYVLSGYAAQRTNDLFSGSAPEQSTAPSRNLDVAALYFPQPVAGGGFGGFLPADAAPNTWLTSAALKMLVGYPVDGSQFGMNLLAGKMYQTAPQTFPLSLTTDPVPGQQQVYLAPWFLSYPGNSGGPLYVQFNGYYYPAAVYLGTLFSGSVPYASVVRAIDSNVVNLITRAASQGDSGTNFTGGGVITIVPSANISAANKAYLQVRLAPPSAVAAGAGWRLPNDASFGSDTNYIRQIISTNAFGVVFKSIPGWSLPASQAITVQPHPSVPTVVTGYYTVNSPLLTTLRVAGTNRLAMTGTTGTVYRLEKKTALTNAAWLPVATNTIRTNGFNPVLTNPAPGFYRLNWLTNF